MLEVNTDMTQNINKAHFVVCGIGGQGIALPLLSVIRVVRAVKTISLPRTPEIVRGVVNFAGKIIPLIDINVRFKLPPHPVRPRDYFIITRTREREIALLVDSIEGSIEKSPADVVKPAQIFAGIEFTAGVLKLEKGSIFIPDLDKILTLAEEKALEKARREYTKKGRKKK